MVDVVRSADAPRPAEPAHEIVSVEGIGDVKVRALKLSERLQVKRKLRKAEDETDALAHVPFLLELAVVDVDGRPLYSAADWERFGSTKAGENACMDLFNVAWRISDMGGGETEKNSEASRS